MGRRWMAAPASVLLAASPAASSATPAAHAALPGHGKVALAGYTITKVTVPEAPPQGANDPPNEHTTSRNISKFAIPELRREARRSNGAHVHTVTGATLTSRAFRRSLQGAIAILQQSPSATRATGPAEVVKPPKSACPSGCGRFGKVQVHIVATR